VIGEDGKGIGGFNVKFQQDGIDIDTKITDSTGYFVSKILENGSYQIEISKNGYSFVGDDNSILLKYRVTRNVEKYITEPMGEILFLKQ
jgi:hypothetical protein